MKETGTYINGEKDGPWTEWHDNGQVKLKESYKNKKRNGKWVFWYENGQIKTEGDYIDSKKSGKWTNWYPWGWRSAEVENQGADDSYFILWFEDQQRSSQGNYSKGRENNIWMWWSREGLLDSSGVFDRGRRIGKWTFRDIEKNKQLEGRYENGILSNLIEVFGNQDSKEPDRE